MNPNSFNATGIETINEPNEWDVLTETNTGNEGELTEATPDNNIAEVGTGTEKEGEETGTEKEGEETGTEIESTGSETA